MTNKQQIEKPLKLDIEECAGFYSAFINDMRISKSKPLSVSKTVMSFDCPKEYILQALGIPENAVVLTGRELKYYKQFLNFRHDFTIFEAIEKEYEKARKETANEFYDKVNENICSFKLENKSQEFIDGYAQAIADICGRLDQVAKQFGLEVGNE